MFKDILNKYLKQNKTETTIDEEQLTKEENTIEVTEDNFDDVFKDVIKEIESTQEIEIPIKEIDNVSEFTTEFFINADKEIKLEETNKELNSIDYSPICFHRNSFVTYRLPNPQTLLTKAVGFKSNKNKQTAEARGHELIKILAVFGIKAQLIDYHIGPSVTKFEIKPDAGVNLSKINSLSDNIKMGLAATSIRIEAPIPGKNAVGVEVPNAENTPVRMSELVTNVPKDKVSKQLLFALGKDLSGTPIFCDLAKMPHLLIAGATGSGKSVCINTIVTSYLLRTRPDEVKLILVDPKKVEFTPYHDIPHLLWPVITDTKMAANMLKKMVVEMERRYDVFAKAAVKDITTYNEKVIENNKNLKEGEEPMAKLPYIVVIIDEMSDLVMQDRKDFESSIYKFADYGLKLGMHLVVSTSNYSILNHYLDIKDCFGSQIVFSSKSANVAFKFSNIKVDVSLNGNGDLMFISNGDTEPTRMQGCLVTDEEIINISNYCRAQAKPEYDDTYFALQESNSSGGSNATSGEEDDLYSEAVDFVAKTKKASTSSLQRRFGIGYNRAARLIDTMEENGLIGPSNGSKAREVYVRSKDEWN